MTNPNQLYEDMGKLNALYEELLWDHEDVLEFVAAVDIDPAIPLRAMAADMQGDAPHHTATGSVPGSRYAP